jgi:alkyldihydroxyacetonephosphate synthase
MHDCQPDMTRLSDADKTALSFAYQSKSTWFKHVLGAGFKVYLKKIKRLNFDTACLMLVAFSGTKKKTAIEKKQQAEAIYKRFGGVYLGAAPGRAFEHGKYDFPYLRDFMMERGYSADVSETATVWSNVLPLYEQARTAILQAITDTGVQAWCGCHISHTYHTGASLYFTFAFQQSDDVLAQYDRVKKASEDAFMKYGGTLSHHHAVGYEHMPWLADDISAVGIMAIQGIKKELDAKGIMNPGKIIAN